MFRYNQRRPPSVVFGCVGRKYTLYITTMSLHVSSGVCVRVKPTGLGNMGGVGIYRGFLARTSISAIWHAHQHVSAKGPRDRPTRLRTTSPTGCQPKNTQNTPTMSLHVSSGVCVSKPTGLGNMGGVGIYRGFLARTST